MQISERQLEIIEAAGQILSESGLGGLTTKVLAKRVGFSESALYRHFPSKEAILLAMLAYLEANIKERFERILALNLAPKACLLALFESQLLYFKANPHFVVAAFSDGLLDDSQRINAAVLQVMATKVSYVFPVLEAGQQAGCFTSRLPAEHLMHILLGSFRLQMFRWRAAMFQFDIYEQGLQSVAAVFTLMEP